MRKWTTTRRAFALAGFLILWTQSAATQTNSGKPAGGSTPGTAIEFVRIQPGTFTMGCSARDSECQDSERPAHPVTLTRSFEIGKYEVTQAQWQSVMGKNPSSFKGDDNCPVDSVSWDDVQAFLETMNARKDGFHYRLPTEAEWEYAARAGTVTAHAGVLDKMAWYGINSGSRPHPVGRKQANAWGLHDMEGNVQEWTQDWWSGSYSSESATDPTGPATGTTHVMRGGAANWMANNIRVSHRIGVPPDVRFPTIGFRAVREAMTPAG